MPTITSLGTGSGLDLESLVGRLVAAERIPIGQLSRKTESLKSELSTFGRVQSALSGLRDAASKLTKPDTFAGNLATSSDPTSVNVSVNGSAAAGSVTVDVKFLATAQTLSSSTFTSAATTLGDGGLTIQLGKYTTDEFGVTSFAPKSGSNPASINIAAGSDSLTSIRDQINSANAGVTASVVSDATGARLVLRSTETGESSGFTVAGSGGLTGLSFDASAGITGMIQTVPAANARAIINGIDISSESNSLKTAIDGLNITLLKTTTFPPTLTIGQDKEAVKKAITDFATAYNAVNALLREQTKFDQVSKTGGILQGDATAVGLQNQLRSIIGGTSNLGGAFTRLAQIGLEAGSDGNIVTSSTKLDGALSNIDSLKKLFMSQDSGGATSNDGFAQRLRAYTDGALSTDGKLSSRQAGLQKLIDGNDKRAAKIEDHVAQTEARLRARYTALDTQVAKLNSLSSYVAQQLKQFEK